ncbi:MAG: prepilin-type N-terminal cleavage/methylation domain-containing protein [Xanthomonadales bacterium]|nr:prepilin-type N-terminal cleavage/methylation domain-containing protein [Xanthomonadales bacterium]
MMIRNKGFSLLEILLAIVIFVVGMLALAHLQTNLTRSATDANTRTVAAGIAEEIIEELRGFRRISTDPNGTVFAFADIDDALVADTVPRGGINYVVTADVKGYDFNSDLTAVTETDPAVAGVVYDFKTIELTVTWNNNQEFLIDEGTTIANTDMDSGYIALKDVIHSTPALADAVIAADEEPAGGPIVDYTPGLNPDIVAIQLSNDAKFKESTQPKPDVIRRDELVETWFDVITYNTVTNDEGGDESYFLRREEFLVVSCECTLRGADSDNPGFKPTVWNGKEYVEGDRVAKSYGESANNQQSPYCDTCCRDHHDDPNAASADELYDPYGTWTSSSLGSNHGHYGKDNQGNLESTPVSAGNDYVESCRMVRKDGFMRVAQDFRQEQFIGLPQSYLADTAGVTAYSSYVTDAIDNFIDDLLNGNSSPDLDGPGDLSPGVTFPADATNNRMDLPVVSPAADSAQLVTRGIYVDHLTAEALAVLDCLAPTTIRGRGESPENCAAEGLNIGSATSYLEVFPFFDVQTTWLSLWEDNVNGNPIAVTNEQLADDNSHSRGLASITSANQGDVTITSRMHRGNVGLAATDPIDPDHYANGTWPTQLYLQANGGGSPPVITGTTFSGVIGAVPGVQASGTTFTGGGGVVCQQNLTQFECIIPDDATSPTLTISGYWKNSQTDLWICESMNELPVLGAPSQTEPKTTVFDLSAVGQDWTDVQFTISTSACTP